MFLGLTAPPATRLLLWFSGAFFFARRRIRAEFALFIPFGCDRPIFTCIGVSSHRSTLPSLSSYFRAAILLSRFCFLTFVPALPLHSVQSYCRWMPNNVGKCEELGRYLVTLFPTRSRRQKSRSFQVPCVIAFCPVLGPINYLSAGPALVCCSFSFLSFVFIEGVCAHSATMSHCFSLFFFRRCNLRTTCLRADRSQGAGGIDPASLGGYAVSHYLPRL